VSGRVENDDRVVARVVRQQPEPPLAFLQRRCRLPAAQVGGTHRCRRAKDDGGEDEHVRRREQRNAEFGTVQPLLLADQAQPSDQRRREERDRQQRSSKSRADVVAGQYLRNAADRRRRQQRRRQRGEQRGRVHGHRVEDADAIQRRRFVHVSGQRHDADQSGRDDRGIGDVPQRCRSRRQQPQRAADQHEAQRGADAHPARKR
jgi:hypothetical protein